MPNERLIYEWLRPVLGGTEWTRQQICDDPVECVAVWMEAWDEEPRSLVLPPLDMNTAFAEAIPKLRSEGVKVCYANPSIFDDESAPWYLQLGDKDPFIHPDFWEALTDYLEAKDA